MAKGKKATAQDAQALMQLYDLRRDPALRAARKFMAEFWPQNGDEFKALFREFGSERNSWARQCLTYWDMAAAMVLHGAIQEDLFFAVNGEPFFLFAKFGHYLEPLRKEYIPDFLVNLEQLARRPQGKQKVRQFQALIEARQKAAAAKAGK
ncbi:MAG: hypothetical protein LAP21_08720 [Acidobacteriia bacterium]|nr:hypothetical protein [Terriglobia bacterium]